MNEEGKKIKKKVTWNVIISTADKKRQVQTISGCIGLLIYLIQYRTFPLAIPDLNQKT